MNFDAEGVTLEITIPATLPFSDLRLARGDLGVPRYSLTPLLQIATESGYSAEQMKAWPGVALAVIIRGWIRLLDAAKLPLFDDGLEYRNLVDELVAHERRKWRGPDFNINLRLSTRERVVH